MAMHDQLSVASQAMQPQQMHYQMPVSPTAQLCMPHNQAQPPAHMAMYEQSVQTTQPQLPQLQLPQMPMPQMDGWQTPMSQMSGASTPSSDVDRCMAMVMPQGAQFGDVLAAQLRAAAENQCYED